MHPMFPCPNPSCSHTFSPEALQGVSSLVCPQCGSVFQLTSGSAKKSAPPRSSAGGKGSKAPPPLPKSAPPPVPPPAQPVAASQGAFQEPPHFDFHSTPEVVVPRTRRPTGPLGKRRYRGWIIGAVIAAVCIGLAVWGGLWIRYFLSVKPVDEESALGAAYNARFVPPGKPWQRDKDIQQRLHVHIGMRSPEHHNKLAIRFKEYKDRLPSEAEMYQEAIATLNSYFQGLETEGPLKDEQTQLADQPAQVCKFQGEDADRVTMNGECYMMACRGYGYWFFTWAPLGELENDREAIQAEWAQLRQRLSLLDERKSWQEKPRETVRITGKKAKYSLNYIKSLWTPQPVGGEDANVDLLLRGHEPDPKRKPLASEDATVQVLVLPKQPDPKAATAAALAYVKQREIKLYEKTTWEPIKDKDGAVDRAADIGTQPGHLSKLHVKNTDELERFLSIAVVNRPQGVIVLVGDCMWERRDFWDPAFTALFSTFKVR